jgi:hypothetical protein
MKRNYRKLWTEHYGKIPKDEMGRSYEIHHKDGDRTNNSIDNLVCISIQEHYDTHYAQGDYGACVMIAKRMQMSPDYLSEIQRGKKRPGIGGVKKGTVPWNKGKKGYKIHDEVSLEKIAKSSRGENNPGSKITEKDAESIIRLYLSKPDLDGVGKIMRNGLPMSYDRMFSIKLSDAYFVTPENITRIIKKKSWKNVWEKISNTNV